MRRICPSHCLTTESFQISSAWFSFSRRRTNKGLSVVWDVLHVPRGAASWLSHTRSRLRKLVEAKDKSCKWLILRGVFTSASRGASFCFYGRFSSSQSLPAHGAGESERTKGGVTWGTPFPSALSAPISCASRTKPQQSHLSAAPSTDGAGRCTAGGCLRHDPDEPPVRRPPHAHSLPLLMLQSKQEKANGFIFTG